MTTDGIRQIWKKYRVTLLAAILAVYTLPQSFFYPIGGALDGSWTRAMNMAVRDHLVFGRDIIFTYGPLAFLNTRNGQYISNVFLFAGDMFLLYGFFHLFRKYMTQYKGWFVLLLCGMLCYKGSGYCQALFLIFIVFAVLNFKNNFSNRFELAYCAVAGIVVSFVKANYGIIALLILLVMAVIMLLKNRKSFAVFASAIVLMWCLITHYARIDLFHYIWYSIPMIEYYNESMFLEMQPTQPEFIYALILMATMALILLVYVAQQARQRKVNAAVIIFTLLSVIACFLFYKNGFTRCDYGHYSEFYSIFPFFIVFIIFYAGYGALYQSKIIAACVILISFINLKEYPLNATTLKIYIPQAFYNSVRTYFSGITGEQEEAIKQEVQSLKLPEDKLKLIGDATTDIIPDKIILLQVNNINYDPRPVIQSYSAYSRVLDSINASHFYKPDRPKVVLMNNGGVDNRYFAWDESMTKATLHLNYRYDTYISLNKDSLTPDNKQVLLLLRSKGASSNWPRFEKTGEETINFGDTVRINYPDSIAVYMTAGISYTVTGELKKIFFQPPLLGVTLLLDNGTSTSYRLIRPIAEQPVLINKFIGNNIDLKNFMTGDLKKNANIRGVIFFANGPGAKQKIKLSFLKFSNY